MALNLTKRSELPQDLTPAQVDANFTAIEDYTKIMFGVVCSDTATDLTVSTKVASFPAPFDFGIVRLLAGVDTGPTGAAIQLDVNKNGTSAIAGTLDISAGSTWGEKTGLSSSFNKGDIVTIDIDQVGSTIAGKWLTVWFEVNPT